MVFAPFLANGCTTKAISDGACVCWHHNQGHRREICSGAAAQGLVYPAKLSAILAPRQLTSFVLAYSFNRSPIRIRSRAFPTPIWLRPRSTDIRVTYELFTKRELEMRWPLAQQPKTIIDGGANVGYASLAFKRRWPEAYVLAIEPDSANLALLQKNYADLKGFDSLQCGILGSACSLQVRSEQAGSAWGLSIRAPPWTHRMELPATPWRYWSTCCRIGTATC
jgi:hypothetical protein